MSSERAKDFKILKVIGQDFECDVVGWLKLLQVNILSIYFKKYSHCKVLEQNAVVASNSPLS